jgi:hypothetical protein
VAEGLKKGLSYWIRDKRPTQETKQENGTSQRNPGKVSHQDLQKSWKEEIEKGLIHLI